PWPRPPPAFPTRRSADLQDADHGFGRRSARASTRRRPYLWGEHACVVLHPGDRRVISDHELARLLELLPRRDEPTAEGCVSPLTDRKSTRLNSSHVKISY